VNGEQWNILSLADYAIYNIHHSEYKNPQLNYRSLFTVYCLLFTAHFFE